MARSRHILVVGGVLLVVVLGVLSVGRMLQRPNVIARLHEDVRELRAAADSCRNALADGEAELHQFNARLDSLRGRVRELESLDPRGVPADSFAIYMNAFELYNDSAGGWPQRVDTLQARLARCRSVTEDHNRALDSLQNLRLEQRGRR